MHEPLHEVVPNGHLHTPFVHDDPAAQVLPQLPQSRMVPLACGMPVEKVTQVPPQLPSPVGQHVP